MFNAVTPSALERIYAVAPQLRDRHTASDITGFTAVSAAKVVRQFNSSPAEAQQNALVRSATR